MRTITLKSIPDSLYERLKEAAEAHRRSLNSEVLVLLERALGQRPADAAEALARVRAVRRAAGNRPLTDAAITAAKGEGRP